MRADIHPDYVVATVTCSCGNTFTTRSTKPTLSSELCSQCHPFYTGKQKLVDTGGRIDRFEKPLRQAPQGRVGSRSPRCRSGRDLLSPTAARPS